jgi:hypothetical protein
MQKNTIVRKETMSSNWLHLGAFGDVEKSVVF